MYEQLLTDNTVLSFIIQDILEVNVVTGTYYTLKAKYEIVKLHYFKHGRNAFYFSPMASKIMCR